MPNEDDRFGDVAEQLKQTEEGAESDDDERTEDTHDEPQPDEEITTEDTSRRLSPFLSRMRRMWTNPPWR